MTGVQTCALPIFLPGTYSGLTRITPPGQDPQDGYAFTLEIEPFAGTDVVPPTYGPYADLLTYGRSWVRQLSSDDDQSGFAAQRGRARTWLEDIIHAHDRGQFWGGGVVRSRWLEEQLAAGAMIVDDQVREAVAKKALAYICEGQIGLGDERGQYARLARMYHGQADYLASCLTIGLDSDGDGLADTAIDLGWIDARRG